MEHPKKSMVPMLLDRASKGTLIRTFSSITLDKTIKEKYKPVACIKRELGVEKTEKLLTILTLDLSESFGKELNREQVEEIVLEISSNFVLFNLPFENIYLCYQKLKSELQYGKLSVNKVLAALHAHAEIKTERGLEIRYNEHLSRQFTDPRSGERKRLEYTRKMESKK